MKGLISLLSDIIHFRRTIQQVVGKCVGSSVEKLQKENADMILLMRLQDLKDKAINCGESGVSDKKYTDHEVIVSLTTYGKRIHEVYLAIESIMQGTLKPNRIVLWLSDELRNEKLPLVLQNQVKRGLQIEYCKDLMSYKKMIPSLKKYHESCVITVDDDLIYEPDIVEHLLLAYIKHPDCVSACRIHTIKFDKEGMMLPYSKWGWLKFLDRPSHFNFCTNGGGAIFPPNCFPEEVFDEEVFMKICRYADDVWFNAMLIKNNVKVNKAFTHSPVGEDYLLNESPNEKCLHSINTGSANQNDVQIQAVFEKYGIFNILRNEMDN